jgi:hypothetical protein
MSSELAVPAALEMLARELRGEPSDDGIFLALRTLQVQGLTQGDLQVHVERIRAANEVEGGNPTVERNSLVALDMIEGLAVRSLAWDPAEIAAISLADLLDLESLTEGAKWAFLPNDLLPPRPSESLPQPVVDQVVNTALQQLRSFEARPNRADFHRVPKAGFTSRPAALLVAADRLYYEAMIQIIVSDINDSLSSNVHWPRERTNDLTQMEQKEGFRVAPHSWGSAYVVVTDLDSYYETVDHSLLATFLTTHLGASRRYRVAIESMLHATMGTQSGLPQGPPGSNLLATAYLLPVDQKLDGWGWMWARFADDYLIGADSVADGRRRLEQMETLLRELGLRLNVAKTRIMRGSTYLHGTSQRSARLEQRRSWILARTEARLLETEDEDEVEQALEAAGVDEETIWDVLYHRTTPLEDVIRQIREELMPSVAESYAAFFAEMAAELSSRELPDDMLMAESDLRECLLILASTDIPLSWDDIGTTLRWFPRTADVVAEYLYFRSEHQPKQVRQFIRAWLETHQTSDWAKAWIASTASRAPELVDPELARALSRVARDRSFGPLTREAALLGLNAAGKLSPKVWGAVFDDASPAVRSELGIVAAQDRSNRAWLNPPHALGLGQPTEEDK